LYSAGDVVVIDFPGVMGVKRRPAVVLSSDVYHATRSDVIVGLITSRAVPPVRPTMCSWTGHTQVCGFRPYFAVSSRPCLRLRIP
jgi:mRNA-degrading endonuclease toxin of MazEF toxin-antitoxin module